ncbi:TetR/AcrR family transcriptional regulator [Actinoplanes sp. NPDC051494]|uniref:TetR/AcrR family transcriptional regulator n=1 Tax=Actinoplanes sp. NPDC051494 TaxID=3363907 RepID=UPI003798686C
MAGRKQFDVDDALDRAMTAFWKHGYADTSLDVLVSATGLGRGSLYGTFGGKDALFQLCVRRYAERYGTRYAAAGDLGSFLQVTLDRIADPAVPDGCLVAQSAALMPALTPDSATLIRSTLDNQRRLIRALVGRDDLAVYVLAVVQSLGVLSRAGVPMDELRTVARLAQDTVSGCRTGAPAAPSAAPATPTAGT